MSGTVRFAIDSLYKNKSGPALRAVAAALPVPAATPVNVLHLLDATRKSEGYSTSTSSTASTGVAGKGYGFRTRFKEMSDRELKELLNRSGPLEKEKKGRFKVSKPVPEHRLGQYATQWTAVGKIKKPYEAMDIKKTDMFAVIEAGHTQFKGKLGDLYALTDHQ
jgi:hypothetical protein